MKYSVHVLMLVFMFVLVTDKQSLINTTAPLPKMLQSVCLIHTLPDLGQLQSFRCKPRFDIRSHIKSQLLMYVVPW